ncbi:MAG: sulfatase-like hydrolase/transferase, partial [Thermoanaerobaculia bacterium]|nr:sulfatase-like hydrolase/transferase [Thermoanaerobaculia bacterium]
MKSSEVWLALVVVAVATACGGGDTGAPCPHCNVVLITFDALRADHLGAYGYPLATSPRLDALAERSTV